MAAPPKDAYEVVALSAADASFAGGELVTGPIDARLATLVVGGRGVLVSADGPNGFTRDGLDRIVRGVCRFFGDGEVSVGAIRMRRDEKGRVMLWAETTR